MTKFSLIICICAILIFPAAWVSKAAESGPAEDPDFYEAIRLYLAHDFDSAGALLEKLMQRDAGRPVAMVYLDLWYQTHEDVYPRDLALKQLQDFLHESAGQSPTFKEHAAMIVSSFNLSLGNLDSVKKFVEDLGYITEWWVAGPFPNEGESCYDREDKPWLGGNGGALKEVYAGKVHEVRWHRTGAETKWGFLFFDDIIRPEDEACAYASAFIYSRDRKPAVLRGAFSDSIRIKLNGREVAAERVQRDINTFWEPFEAPVVLMPGWNRLLIKSADDSGSWAMSFRFTDPDGNPLRLKNDSDPKLWDKPVPKSEAAEFQFRTNDILLLTKQESESWPENTGALWAWSVVQDNVKQEGLQLADELLESNPGFPPYLLFKILLETDRTRRVAALESLISSPVGGGCVECLLALGREWESMHLDVKAGEQYEKAAALNPGSFRAQWRRYEWLQNTMGFDPEAAAAFEKIKTLFPRNPAVAYEEASSRIPSGTAPGGLEQKIELLTEAYDSDRQQPVYARNLAQLYVRAGHIEQAEKVIDQAFEYAPFDGELLLSLARWQLGAGRLTEAEAAVLKALDVAPDDSGAYSLLGDIIWTRGDKTRAIENWEKSLALEPTQPALVERLEAVRTRETKSPFDAFKPDIKELLARKVDDPEHNAVYLLDQKAVIVHSDGTSSERTLEVIRVLNESGVEDLGARYLIYDPELERIKVIAARVYDPRGAVFEAEEIDNVGSPSRMGTIYYRDKYNMLKFHGLSPGSTIVMEVQKDLTGANIFGDYFGDYFLFGGFYPAIQTRYVLLAPPEKKFYFETRGVPKEPSSTSVDPESGMTVRIFELKDLKAVKRERSMPPLFELSPIVKVSTFSSWDELGKWYYGLIRNQFDSDSNLKAKTAELTNGLSSVDDKINALYKFVVNDVRYLGHEYGIGGWKPHRATETFANRYGDCKDKAALLVAMLKEIGVDADLVIIGTRNAFGLDDFDLPWLIANHSIARVHIPGGGIHYVDGTARNVGFREPISADMNRMILYVGEKGIGRERTPLPAPELSGENLSLQLKFDKDGNLWAQLGIYGSGAYNNGIREMFRLESKREETAKNILSRFGWGGAVIQEIKVSDLLNIEEDARVDISFSVPDLAGSGKNKVSIDPFVSFESFADDFDVSEANRLYPLELPIPAVHNLKARIEIPDGWKVTSKPGSAEVNDPYVDFKLEVGGDGKSIEINAFYKTVGDRVPVEQFAAFRSHVLAMDRAVENKITLERVK